MIAEKGKALVIGNALPEFDLPGVDGKNHSSHEFAAKKVLVMIFTCNHCPYAQAYQDRIITLQKEFGERGLQVVAINSNDAVGYPDDSFENMLKRAKEKNFNFPYLRDESQAIAKAFGAQVTPDCFVFDEKRKLVYRGRVDDNWQKPEQAKTHELKNAVTATLAGKKPSVQEANAIGCSIKWKY